MTDKENKTSNETLTRYLCEELIKLAGNLGSEEMNDIGNLEAEILKLERLANKIEEYNKWSIFSE